MGKRQDVVAKIKEGGATRDSLMTDLRLTNKALSGLFTTIRLTGQYPVANADGVLSLLTADEFEAWKAQRPTKKAPTMDVERRMRLNRLRLENAKLALTRWLELASKNKCADRDQEMAARVSLANAELALAEILVAKYES